MKDAISKSEKRIGIIEESVKGLKKTDDEKVAETLVPKAALAFAWKGEAASKKEDTKVDPKNPRQEPERDGTLVAAEGMAQHVRGQLGC